MSCSPNTEITWDIVHDLAQRVDNLTSKVGYPNATYLMDDLSMPFSLPRTQSFSGAIRFAVQLGTDTVQFQHLTSGLTSLNKYELSDPLQSLADEGELYLKVEEDGCWCSTLFKVEPDVSLSEPLGGSIGCCQTLYVPQSGDRLDRGQHIVPAGHVHRYTEWNTASWLGTSPWYFHPACEKGRVECGFHFEWDKEGGGGVGADIYKLLDVTREIRSAKFVWPIRASYMDALWGKIEKAADCENNTGYTRSTTCEYCTPSLAQIMGDAGLGGDPGCMVEEIGNNSEGDPIYSIRKPWEEPSCGGSSCDKGPRVYCKTFQDLDQIVSILRGSIKPYRNDASGCCSGMQLWYEYEGDQYRVLGFAGDCPACGQNDYAIVTIHFGDSLYYPGNYDPTNPICADPTHPLFEIFCADHGVSVCTIFDEEEGVRVSKSGGEDGKGRPFTHSTEWIEGRTGPRASEYNYVGPCFSYEVEESPSPCADR